jgi:hypothetical protein
MKWFLRLGSGFAAGVIAIACSGTDARLYVVYVDGRDAGSTSTESTDKTSSEVSSPQSLDASDARDGAAEADGCATLECKIVACPEGQKTTLRGKVYDPAGANPLYNVMVYIPGGPDPENLPPMKDSTQAPDGIACETCASVVVSALRSALTNARGEFVLDDVPVGKAVPVVVQVGKWRRLLHVDVTKSCEENEVPDGDLRLPRNGTEGDMPQIAVTTGGADALECLLRGIGVDDTEFVNGHNGNGHVHLFKGYGGKMGVDAQSFWNDAAQLRKYDLLLLSCEGTETLDNKGGSLPDARRSLDEYLNAGGRLLATHYQYVWLQSSPASDLRKIATFKGFGDGASSGDFDVNVTFPDGSPFPKGKALAEWLYATGASRTLGKIPLEAVRNSVQTLAEPGLSWILKRGSASASPANIFSFNAPISAPPENQCGRAVYTDIHVTDQAGPTSLYWCEVGPGFLNSQQKALEFFLFDLSACVMSDREVPQPPK